MTTEELGIPKDKIEIVDHHLSHASSAFFASPFEKALIMVLEGDGNALDPFKEIHGEIREINPDGSAREVYKGIRYW